MDILPNSSQTNPKTFNAPKRNKKTTENKTKRKYHEIIPMLNPSKANNCFINVIIQILYHTPKFKQKFLKMEFPENDNKKKNNPLYQLQRLLFQYNEGLYSEKKCMLEIKNFRKAISHYFIDMSEGINGDPVEGLNNILNAIHLYSTNQKLNAPNPSSYECHNCISHEFFSLSVKDRIYCSDCNRGKTNFYDKNYFIYEIFISEILEKILNLEKDKFKNELFSIAKKVNNIAEQKIKIEGCSCKNRIIKREVYQCYYYNPIFIINLTWERQFPNRTDICNIYYLIPLLDENGRIFTLEDNNLNVNYYLYGIILYYNGHYTCAIYKDNFWFFIDDSKFFKFDSYIKLISALINSSYYPVMLFYSYNDTNLQIKKDGFMANNYESLYHKCYKIDIKNGENVSNHNILLDTWEKENSWICHYCKKRNDNAFFSCWCCKNQKYELKKDSFFLLEENIKEKQIKENIIDDNNEDLNKKEIKQNQFNQLTYDMNNDKNKKNQNHLIHLINDENITNNINNFKNKNPFNNNKQDKTIIKNQSLNNSINKNISNTINYTNNNIQNKNNTKTNLDTNKNNFYINRKNQLKK